jgi:predicted TPR repeat methyltransferase
LYRQQRRVFLRSLKGLCPDWAAARILDIGPGVGFFVELWRSLGVKTLVGLDIAQTAVDRLSERYPGYDFRRGHIGSRNGAAALEPASFDFVSAIAVLYHIVDDAEYANAYHSIASLLAPDGTLIFSENLLTNGEVRSQHAVARSEATVLALIRDAGLRIVSRRPLFVLMNEPVGSRTRRRKRFWKSIQRLAQRGERVGSMTGMALYPFETVLTTLCKRTPSTELIVCRKVSMH